MRKIMTNNTARFMAEVYNQLGNILDEGGLVYETRSAIWAYEPVRERVLLIVKRPDNMTNTVLDYTVTSKHFEKHRDRIIKLCAGRAVAYTPKIPNEIVRPEDQHRLQ